MARIVWGSPECGSGGYDVQVGAPSARAFGCDGYGEMLDLAVQTGGRITNLTWCMVVACEVERDARVAARGVRHAAGLTAVEEAALIDDIAAVAMSTRWWNVVDGRGRCLGLMIEGRSVVFEVWTSAPRNADRYVGLVELDAAESLAATRKEAVRLADEAYGRSCPSGFTVMWQTSSAMGGAS